jgi:hypothetical protein
MLKRAGDQMDGAAVHAQGAPSEELSVNADIDLASADIGHASGNAAGRLIHTVDDDLKTATAGLIPPLNLAA